MQQSCKPLYARLNADEVWQTYFSENYTGDASALPRKIIQAKDWKSVVKLQYGCLRVLQKIQQMHLTGPQPRLEFTTTEESDELFEIMQLYTKHCGSYYPQLDWISQLLDILAMDSTGAFASAIGPVLLPTIHTLLYPVSGDDTMIISDTLQLISSLALGSSDFTGLAKVTGLANALSIFHGSEAHLEACAAMAAIRSAEYMSQFHTRALAPSRSTRMTVANLQRSDFNFGGLYHTFISYDDARMYGCHEKGLFKLAAHNDGTYGGSGVDTIGRFTIEPVPGSLWDLTGNVLQWVQKYPNVSLRFEGVIHPHGVGGTFGPIASLEEGGETAFYGTWFMCPDRMTTTLGQYWDAMQSHIAEETVERKKWAIQSPWALEPSEFSQVCQGLAFLSSQLFLIRTPGVSTQNMLRLTQSLPARQVPEELITIINTPFTLGPRETNEKLQTRKEIYYSLFVTCMETRMQFLVLQKNRLRSDAAIISNPEHPKCLEILQWWVHHLSTTHLDPLFYPEVLAAELVNTASLIESNGLQSSVGNEAQEQDDLTQDVFSDAFATRRKARGGLSTTTFVTLSTIGIAVVAIGAFFVGRFLGSRKD
jgi:hypothetical protein